MNRLLVTKELKRDFKVFIIVALANTGFILLTLLMYGGMKESMMAVTDLYSKMPAGFAEALNFHEGQWNTILGFYATYIVYYGPLFLSMYSIYLGSSLLSKEEYTGTAEFLLAKPLTRNEILSSKLMVLLTYTLIPNIILWINGVIWCGIDTGFPETFSKVTTIHTYSLFINLFFGSLGLLITTLMKRARPIIGPAMALVFGAYMIDIILRISNTAELLLYATPFKYINIDLTNPEYHMEWWRIAVMAGTTLIMILAAFRLYKRKDILL